MEPYGKADLLVLGNIITTDEHKALTTNVACMLHEEDRMGSLEVGKVANITVFDKDFLNDDLADVENA